MNESMRAGTFLKECEAAAMKDDGVVSREEQAVLKKLQKTVQEYVIALEKLLV
ncbi:MAG: hypothetical protein IKW90_11705 [Lachnospiraceae bacterium]|nr:hypothetical protein [Lachnospiraceae bacterium]